VCKAQQLVIPAKNRGSTRKAGFGNFGKAVFAIRDFYMTYYVLI
jgi:hypothetical protein